LQTLATKPLSTQDTPPNDNADKDTKVRACLTYDYVTDDAINLLGERNFNSVLMLGSMLILRTVGSSLLHNNALQHCIALANLWLTNLDQPIEIFLAGLACAMWISIIYQQKNCHVNTFVGVWSFLSFEVTLQQAFQIRGPIDKIKILWEHYITGESLRQLYVIYLYFYLQLYDLIYRCGAMWKRSEINMLGVYDLYNSWYTTMLYVSRIMHLNWVFLEVPLVSLQ
jgi:hypothetical protein